MFCQVSPLLESPQKGAWKRREFTVLDDDESNEIRVKLWDEHADLIDDTFLGKDTEVKNVKVDRWNNRNTLGSTDETIVRVRYIDNSLTFTKMQCTPKIEQCVMINILTKPDNWTKNKISSLISLFSLTWSGS